MFSRTRRALAIALLALLAGPIQALRLQAQAEPNKPVAAHPEAGTHEETSSKEEGKSSEAEGIRNSPAVRGMARVLHISTDAAYWLSVLLNFAIVAVALGVLLRKTLPGMFKARNEAIQKRIEEARKASEEARRRLTEVEGRLARLDVEITEMRRVADENARAEEKRIMSEAELERRRIVASAEQEIASAAGNARRELKAYAAGLAVDLAAKRIKVGKDADQSLVRDFTAQLGKDGN